MSFRLMIAQPQELQFPESERAKEISFRFRWIRVPAIREMTRVPELLQRLFRRMKTLTSPQNAFLKQLRLLRRTRATSRGRVEFIVEGIKLVEEALDQRGLEAALFSQPFTRTPTGASLAERLEARGVLCYSVEARLFRQASQLKAPEGVLATGSRQVLSLDSLENDTTVVAAGIQDPGNLGAIARVAEAVGNVALINCTGSADPFSIKSLRGSMGSLLRVPVIDGGRAESALAFLAEKGFHRIACMPLGGQDFREFGASPPVALVLGGESRGLPQRLLASVDRRVSIPMKPPVQSLNVAVVTGILLYEIARSAQREP